MKLALLGMGRMGQEIDRLARAAGHDVVARIDIAPAPDPAPLPDQLRGADVVVDFTVPGAVLGNIEGAAVAGTRAAGELLRGLSQPDSPATGNLET